VLAGKTCVIKVTFTPTQIGTRTGTLTINDNAANTPQTVALSGIGGAQATLTPTTATYPARTVGTTSPAKVFTLTNKQSVALTGISASATGDFSVSTSTCGASLAAKANCKISVTFTPTKTGTRTGTLSVADSASGSPQTSALTGTGK
jgi:Abnormal spindle-like microcephaly-assoc'd, ASPM-SPD-2-Hydin